jgi:hypothetical protein
MAIQAGFAALDITPQYWPVRKYGGLRKTVYAHWACDPPYARAAVFEADGKRIAIISLDIVIIEWEHVQAIRENAEEKLGIPAESILVCATHNHSCAAVITRPVFEREEPYLEFMRNQAVEALAVACDRLQYVSVGFASDFEGRVSFNRRFVMRDGTIKTLPTPADSNIRYVEGPIDPEIATICCKDAEGRVIGVLVNFACHATHKMGGDMLSAGYPGAVCRRVREAFGVQCTCLFLNGACANLIHINLSDPDYIDDPEHIGRVLASDAFRMIQEMDFSPDVDVDAITRDIELPLRDFSTLEEDLKRPEFTDPLLAGPDVYEASLKILQAIKADRDYEPAHVQVLRLGDVALACIPAEYFTEHGLRIKMQSPVESTLVVSLANGWVGYVPTVEAFSRPCGHETTNALWSKLIPEAGDMLADTALELLRGL